MLSRRIAPFLLGTLALAACGSADDGNTADTESTSTPRTEVTDPPVDSDPSTPATTDEATTTTSTTTSAATTDEPTDTPPPTTAEPPPELIPTPIDIPTGSVVADTDDVFASRIDGDLVLLPDALTGNPGTSVLIADYPDPTGPVNEGPGPNVVDSVAGVVDGSVIFGDCCEPISGNVLAASGDIDEVAPIAPGYSPAISPDGTMLATANNMAIAVYDTDSGEGATVLLNQDDPAGGFLNIEDLMWVSDDELALLAWDDDGYALHPVDETTLELGEPRSLDVPRDLGTFDQYVRFAGHGPNGEPAVAADGDEGTRIRYFLPDTFVEQPGMERALPASATSVRLADDGVGLMWVDGDNVYSLPAFVVEPIVIGTGFGAAWFAV